MAWQQTPYTFWYVAVAMAMCVIATLAHRSRDQPGTRPLIALILMAALWGAGTAGVAARADLGGKLLFSNVAYLAIATIPVWLLLFVTKYTNRETLLTRYGPVPLLAVPAATQVLVWTNDQHGLMWRTRELMMEASGFTGLTATWGPWFWVHSVYSYVLVAVAIYLIIRMLLVTEDLYRGQATAILVGVFAPWVSNAVYIGGFVELPTDPTPIAFSVSAVTFFFAIYRHQLLDLMPVAREVVRDEMMDNLAEGVFVLDGEGRIVDVNERGENILDTSEHALLGKELRTAVPEFEAVLAGEKSGGNDGSRTEVALRRNGALGHYDVHVTELRRGGDLFTGRLVSIRDVTERRQREQRLNVLNRALRHDLRNEANVILGYAELGMQNNPEAEWVREIQDAVSGMIDLSAKARQIEQAIGNGDVSPESMDMVSVVESAVADLSEERSEVAIQTDVPAAARARAIEFVGAAVTNALENAVEHNDNPDPLIEVSVSVRTTEEGVLVEIADNGPGIHPDEREVLLRGRETQLEHVSGLGLWMINWIITESGGDVRFAENDPRGSIIIIRLPEGRPEPTADGEIEPSAESDTRSDDTETGEAAGDDTAESVDGDVRAAGESTGNLSSPVEGSEFGPS